MHKHTSALPARLLIAATTVTLAVAQRPTPACPPAPEGYDAPLWQLGAGFELLTGVETPSAY